MLGKLGYYFWNIFGGITFVAGLIMVAGSIESESVYWLIFGLAVAFGSVQLIRSMEHPDDRAARYERAARYDLELD